MRALPLRHAAGLLVLLPFTGSSCVIRGGAGSADTTPLETSDSYTDCAAAGISVEATNLTAVGLSSPVTAATLQVDLSAGAAVAAACVNDGDPEEVHLVEGQGSSSYSLRFDGLLASTAYTCRVAIACGTEAGSAPEVQFTTEALPSFLPSATMAGDPAAMTGGAFTLFNHQGTCESEQELVVMDPEGRVRWYYELPDGLTLGVATRSTADGHIAWGGGTSPDGAPQIMGLEGEVKYRVTFDGSEETFFHHDGKALADGTVVALSESNNTYGSDRFTGFRIQLFDSETNTETWSWDSQTAVDSGDLPPGDGDAWHPNWVDVGPEGDSVWVSLVNLDQLVEIDIASGEIVSKLGIGGDYVLKDDSGNQLESSDWFQGQHGPDFDGDKLLIYDNGREQSRVSILTVDRAARVATLNWSWEGEGWHEKILGDADWLPENHVLVHRAHSECIYDTGVATETWEVDRATGEVVWSLALDDIWASSYRAERVESCLLWQDARYCEKTRSRLDELAPEFGW